MICLFSTLLAEEPKETTPVEKSSSLVLEQKEVVTPSPGDFSPAFPHYFKRMLLSLGLLIGLLILTVWALKRLMRSREKEINEQKQIKILEKRVLSSKSLLYLVEVEGEKILLAESHLEIRPLHSIKNK